MGNQKLAQWILRVGVAGEFAGHGVFALRGEKNWVGWFANFGLGDQALAADLLFCIGLLDLLIALTVLVRPIRLALLWATFWGFFTAVLRPFVGLSIWDFIERSANWAGPLALLFLLGWPRSLKDLLKSN
ncbi:MAG: hypothetical protein EXS38_01375 [Opitutus sp.]|nr:hypothetical protein [Opitutus sp.]